MKRKKTKTNKQTRIILRIKTEKKRHGYKIAGQNKQTHTVRWIINAKLMVEISVQVGSRE